MGKASDLLVGNYGFDPRGQQRELQLAAGMSIQSRRSNQQLCIRHWRYSLPEATPLGAGDVIAGLALFTLLRRRAAWSLAGLITQRSEVRILPPRPLSWGKTLNCILVPLTAGRLMERTCLSHTGGIYSGRRCRPVRKDETQQRFTPSLCIVWRLGGLSPNLDRIRTPSRA